jgi:hypothetical protein
MPASLLSEKIHSASKEYSVDAVPGVRGDEDAPIRSFNPNILRRATLKIDFYLIPMISMFRELNLFLSTLHNPLSLPFQDLLYFIVSTAAVSLLRTFTRAHYSRIDRMLLLFRLFLTF